MPVCWLMLRLSLITLVIFAGNLVMSALLPGAAQAQSIAMSGTFYRQHFQLEPGESLSHPDIYVTVYNPGEEEISVELKAETPPDVTWSARPTSS